MNSAGFRSTNACNLFQKNQFSRPRSETPSNCSFSELTRHGHTDIGGQLISGSGFYPPDQSKEIQQCGAVRLGREHIFEAVDDLLVGSGVLLMKQSRDVNLDDGSSDGVGFAVGPVRNVAEDPNE